MPRKDKCFSTCRKHPKTDCDPPKCHYTNGNKYRYCRLAFTHKMNADCVPELKASKTRRNTTVRADKTPNPTPVMNLLPGKDAITEFREKYLKNAATRKIGKFLRKHDPRVRSKFLQSVCSDAGVCIAFGKHASAIRKHFDNFDNFAMLSSPAKTIGSKSSNGFVKELTYMHRGYVANAVLKSCAKMTADNLLYEALVGFQLNKYSTRFPSFLETYGLYQYNNDGVAYRECKNQKNTAPEILSAGLTRLASKRTDINSSSILRSCNSPASMSVLIQHLKGVQTIKEKIKDSDFNSSNELLYVLFQVYMTLASLSSVFTHYDLHWSNVLVYEPVGGSYIEYHYHIEGNEVVFNSPYIAKIIDYGRCFFKENGDTSIVGNSKLFYDEVCARCKPKCGSQVGFGWLEYKKTKLPQDAHISSQISNPSHDLRLLCMIGGSMSPGIPHGLQEVFDKVVYGKGVAPGLETHGTKPEQKSGLPAKINNVADAFKALLELVEDVANVTMNNRMYAKMKKLGELHVHDDGTPLQYVSSK